MYIHVLSTFNVCMYVWYPGVYTHVLNNRILNQRSKEIYFIYIFTCINTNYHTGTTCISRHVNRTACTGSRLLVYNLCQFVNVNYVWHLLGTNFTTSTVHVCTVTYTHTTYARIMRWRPYMYTRAPSQVHDVSTLTFVCYPGITYY